MDSPNHQFETKTEYKDRDKGTGAWAIKPGPPAIPPIPFVPGAPVFTENFEGIPWSDLFLVSVDGWSVQTIDSHSPIRSFETDHLGAYVYDFIFNDFSFSPQLSFWFKTDLVPVVNDIFEVLLDGTPVFTVTEPVLDWTYVAIDKGFAFNIEFRFTQNFPIVTNNVFVRVDDIIVGDFDTPGVPGSPAHPYVYTPLVLCSDDRLLVSPAVETILEVPEVIVETEDFETDPITGSGTWTLTASSPHTGLRCLRSAVISDSQTTDYTFTVPVGVDTIRFWCRVSSEDGFDWFRVYKDSVSPANLLYEESGTANVWTQQTADITGSTSVIFRYSKDSSASSGEDAAFIDDIEWVTAAIPEHEECAPLRLTTNGELEIRPLDCTTDSVTVCPPASGIFDVEIINEVDTRPLDCTTDSVTVCPPASGIFDVEIVNEVDTRPLDCVTDSVTICPGDDPIPVTLDEPIDVNVVSSVEVEIKNDVGNPVPVSFTRLDCLTDSVEVCGQIIVTPGRRPLLGLYYGNSGAIAYTSAADAATGGDLWLVNTSNTVVVYLREVRFTANIAALALLTALPRINMERMTFTGTPSGPTITPAKRDSTDANNTGTLRTTNAGMAPITAGAVIKGFTPPSSDVIGGLLAANASSAVPVEQIFVGDIDSYVTLRQNEGIVFRQANAGSLTENRVYQVDLIWEEI